MSTGGMAALQRARRASSEQLVRRVSHGASTPQQPGVSRRISFTPPESPASRSPQLQRRKTAAAAAAALAAVPFDKPPPQFMPVSRGQEYPLDARAFCELDDDQELRTEELRPTLAFRAKPASSYDLHRRELAIALALLLAFALMFALGWLARAAYPPSTSVAHSVEMRLVDGLEPSTLQRARRGRLRTTSPMPIVRIWQQLLVRV